MSKEFKTLIAVFPLILLFLNNCSGQQIEATITIRDVDPPVAEIRGKFTSPRADRHLSILREFGGFSGLADRVSDVSLESSDGQSVAFKQFLPGEYVAEKEFTNWRYRMDLSPLKRPAASGHTSWISSGTGLLFLRDLLPILTKNSAGKITLELPSGWSSSKDAGTFTVADVDEATVLIGRGFRIIRAKEGDIDIKIFAAGKWQFQDDQMTSFTSEIIRSYSERIGPLPIKYADILYVPFPQTASLGSWEGDTRSNTIAMVASDMPFQTQSVQRLHEQLRHEIFHLWFPNGVNLAGNYDWFYEGFALYESLKLGVAVNRLRFDDFLDTLGRAITIDSMLKQQRSLIDTSNSRSGVADTTIYARGMLAGLLADVELLKRSGGKEDVSSILRTVYRKHQSAAASTDGNTAVLNAINSQNVTRFVNGTEAINWANELSPAGIDVSGEPGMTRLNIKAKPSSSQRKLLDKLGYNNWRRSPSTPR
jgi:hypothetical protein